MPAGDAKAPRPRGARLWWWVVVAFMVQIAVWTAWLVFAGRHPVQEVPLATSSGGAGD